MTKRFVICGMPRSGTSILYTLLANAIKEVEIFDGEKSALSMGSSDEVYLTKRPLDCMDLDEIFSTFHEDDVRVIILIRDPRDVICSTHVSVPHDYFIGYQNHYYVNEEKGYTTLTNPGIRGIVLGWLRHKDKSNVLTLTYEELVSNKTETVRVLANFLDIELDDKSFDVEETTQVPKNLIGALNGIRKLNTSTVGIWKKHPIRVWDEFTSHKELHDIMRHLGYERNADWFFSFFRGKLPIEIKTTHK